MFRASALWIVLTLAVGPNGSLLCRTWCDQQAAAEIGCHHEDAGTSVSTAGGDCCDNRMLGAAALLLPDARPGVSSPDGDHAIPTRRYPVALSTMARRPGQEPGRKRGLENRALLTVLRT